jgi:hypothetical protein
MVFAEARFRRTIAGVTNTVQYWLRASLPGPPGKANDDEQRRAIYRAAMQQFEELLHAAAVTGYAARPLPLFYALSQAGRAIVASHGGEPAQSHGLTLREKDICTDDPLETLVTPAAGSGWFQAAAEAAISPGLPGPVPLGALIASLPELSGELLRLRTWPRALFVAALPGPEPKPVRIDGSRWFSAGITIRREEGESPETVARLLKDYPAVMRAGYRLPGQLGRQCVDWDVTAGGASIVVLLGDPLPGRSPQEAFDAIAPQYRWAGRRWLRPSLAGAEPPTPLMTWWVLLFTLSMLARYHPVEWAQALDRRSSWAATELERAMDMAIDALPQLILATLARLPALLPPFPEIPPLTLTPP